MLPAILPHGCCVCPDGLTCLSSVLLPAEHTGPTVEHPWAQCMMCGVVERTQGHRRAPYEAGPGPSAHHSGDLRFYDSLVYLMHVEWGAQHVGMLNIAQL
jgi:hypothetical protein